MRKWIWCAAGVAGLAGAYFTWNAAVRNPQSWLGRVIHAVAGTQDHADNGKQAALSAPPVPLPGPEAYAPVPPPAPLPSLQAVEVVEPIAVELPDAEFAATTLAVPAEIIELIPPPSMQEVSVASALFMPPALEDFDVPFRRMPYADEDPKSVELIPSPTRWDEATDDDPSHD
ncbi:MAG: hypothetical protein HY040_22835 [Planctomycetes bacterium]|nr:hypothetical protein [Planctomycetota bacterium]